MYNTTHSASRRLQMQIAPATEPDTKAAETTDAALTLTPLVVGSTSRGGSQLVQKRARTPLALDDNIAGRSNSRFSMCRLPSEVTLGAMRELRSCEKARTSHNGNSRKFVESGE
jgi:hypothetical protein